MVAPRTRRTAEEARAAILDAAERRLVTQGPAGIRLQEVAADVGVSHPTVLHHFGNRETLVRAVCERSFEAIHSDVVDAIARSAGGEGQLAGILHGVWRALTDRGHGRVVTWLALEGYALGGAAVHLRDVAVAAHSLRKRKHAGGRTPSFEDTQHVVTLATLALIAQSVLGPEMLADVGLGDSLAAGAEFRAWLARLLTDHLDGKDAR